MATIQVSCRHCSNTNSVKKYGKNPRGAQRYRCFKCGRSFILDYAYEAWKPNVKEKIIDMAMNSSGVRETSRVLNVGLNTVLRTLKKSKPKTSNDSSIG